jgi:uncharacterized protein YcaQ
MTLEHLRRYAVARSLFKPTTLKRALDKFGFLQADPIRAPARAQDLTLRHRVKGYRAGDLERRYARLPVEEDFFVNYGFVSPELQALMHPRSRWHQWSRGRFAQAETVLAFVREHRIVHPREVDAHFDHGKAKNWFGGNSNVTTQLLDAMHYRGMLRVAKRAGGTRVYAVREPTSLADHLSPVERLDAMVDVIVGKYAPLPALTLSQLTYRLKIAAPQFDKHRRAAFKCAKERLPHAHVDGIDWYWPADENPASRRWRLDEEVRLLAPFDPIVWDRKRFEHFWEWAYRFEAYVPKPKRKLGYYAMPLLWRGVVVGWGNVSVSAKRGMQTSFGYTNPKTPRSTEFQIALTREVERLRVFLGGEAPPEEAVEA